MDFLGIGPMELLFIILIALIVLGPKDMLQASRTIGKLLRKLFTSESWREFRKGMESVKTLPYKMAREAGLDEDLQTISQETRMDIPNVVLPIRSEEYGGLKTIDQVIEEEQNGFDGQISEKPEAELDSHNNKKKDCELI